MTEVSHSFDKSLEFLYNIVTFLNTTQMTVITEEGGRQNMFASEPPMQYDETYKGYGPHAELLNGRLAMLGFIAAIVSYATSGSIFFFGAFGI